MAHLEYCEVPKLYFRKTKIYNVLRDFLDSGKPCAKIVVSPEEYSNSCSVQSTYSKCAKKHRFSVKVITSNKEVYLINTAMVTTQERDK